MPRMVDFLLFCLSLLWGWILHGNMPDRFDLIGGAAISLSGVFVIMYWPR
jgi:drug/metabolite transporter superfamily protein YnfA